ncbi:glycosyltransferase [Caulobacter sp. LARHSG274]
MNLASLILYGLAALFLLAAQHPFVTYKQSLRLFRRRALIVPDPSLARPSLSVCMCAYREEAVIAMRLDNLLTMTEAYGGAEVLVYVDGSDDRTAEIALSYEPRIRVVNSPVRTGKTAGMKRLVAAAKGELIACTDANVLGEPDALIKLAQHFQDPAIGCVSAKLAYVNRQTTQTANSGAIYWEVEENLKRIESETVGLIGVDGALFMIRAKAYRDTPDELIDDLYVSLSVLKQGLRVISAPDVVVTEKSAEDWREEFRRKRRISCQGMMLHLRTWSQWRTLPFAQAYGYVSHRLLKWLIPFTCSLGGLFLVLGLAVQFGFLRMVLAIAACGLALLVLALAKFRPARLLTIYLAMLAAVGTGVIEALFFKRTYQTWAPAASVRD